MVSISEKGHVQMQLSCNLRGSKISSSGGFTMWLTHVSMELRGMAKTCLRQFHFQLPSFAEFIT